LTVFYSVVKVCVHINSILSIARVTATAILRWTKTEDNKTLSGEYGASTLFSEVLAVSLDKLTFGEFERVSGKISFYIVIKMTKLGVLGWNSLFHKLGHVC
jgi:hypothetical protein